MRGSQHPVHPILRVVGPHLGILVEGVMVDLLLDDCDFVFRWWVRVPVIGFPDDGLSLDRKRRLRVLLVNGYFGLCTVRLCLS